MNQKSQGHASSPRDLKDSELWIQLQNAINLRSSQDQVLWSIFGVFWAANAILLVALFATGKFPSNPIVIPLIACLGIALCYVWYAIQKRALGHIVRHEELMRRVEKKLDFDPYVAASGKVNPDNTNKYLKRGPSARNVMPMCSKAGIWLWAIALILFVVVELL